MKQQVAISLAGLMLLTAGCENAKGKLGAVSNGKPPKATPQDVGERNMHDQWQGKSNPSLYEGGFFARADFLYWRADESGLEYALTSTPNQSAYTVKGKMVGPSAKWDPGFRVGVGYTFSSQDYWDLSALWTHFQTRQAVSKAFDVSFTQGFNGTALIPYWGATILGAYADQASAKWNLYYNIYDLDLGRNYFVSKTVSVHPFVGIRGATIDQKYHAKYHVLLSDAPISEADTSFQATTDFWGVGAHIGSQLQWRMTRSFSFVGNVGGSLLYGNFKIKEKILALVAFGNPITRTLPITLDEHITTGAFNIEALVGFQWEKFFYNNKYRLAITAGYEWSEWFSQNRLIKFDVASSTTGDGADIFTRENGDLALQGANLQVRWDF